MSNDVKTAFYHNILKQNFAFLVSKLALKKETEKKREIGLEEPSNFFVVILGF
jgi:hypothetical protein